MTQSITRSKSYQFNWTTTLYCGILSILSLVGLVSIAVRMIYGIKVTTLTSPVAWGLWVALYIYFIGLSVGLFLLSTTIYAFRIHQYEKIGRLSLLSALFAFVAGMVFVLIDLGHPLRFWKVLTHWNYTSVLAWEVLIFIFYSAVLSLMLWYLIRCDLAELALKHTGWRSTLYRLLSFGFRCPQSEQEYTRCHTQSLRVVRVLGIIGVPTAIMTVGSEGSLFAVVVAKSYWATGLFSVILLVSALASGCALITFLYAFFGPKDENHFAITRGMANLMVLFICIDLILLTSEYLVGLYGKVPEHIHVYKTILFGPHSYTFWIGQLLMGTIIPILIVALPRTRGNIFWLGIAGLLAVSGIVAVRYNLVIPTFVVPMIEGLEHTINQPRWVYYYFPSFWEWASSIGTIALMTLMFSIAFSLLPIFPESPERFKQKEGGVSHA